MQHATPLGNFLHLALFVCGAAFLGVVALAVLERLGGGATRIGARHVLVAAVVLLIALGAELLYHRVH